MARRRVRGPITLPIAYRNWLAESEAHQREWDQDNAAFVEFWTHVDIRDGRECWEWKGARNGGGYGVIPSRLARSLGEKTAHRFAVRMHGDRPDHRLMTSVLHSCDTAACCNPRHLRWGSAEDNSKDMHIARWSKLALQARSDGASVPTEWEARGIPADREDRRCRGERHHKAKLTTAIVVEIRSLYDAGVATGEIAAKFGLSSSHVNSVGDRQIWRHVS